MRNCGRLNAAGKGDLPNLNTPSVFLKSDETLTYFWQWLKGKVSFEIAKTDCYSTLKTNMIAAGKTKPVVVGVTFEGHHIIPLSSFQKTIKINGRERSILQDAVWWGFNPNAAINGAWIDSRLHKGVISFFDHPNYSTLVNRAFENLSNDIRYTTALNSNSPVALREVSFQLTNEILGKLNRFIDEAIRTNTPLDVLSQQKNFDLITNYP